MDVGSSKRKGQGYSSLPNPAAVFDSPTLTSENLGFPNSETLFGLETPHDLFEKARTDNILRCNEVGCPLTATHVLPLCVKLTKNRVHYDFSSQFRHMRGLGAVLKPLPFAAATRPMVAPAFIATPATRRCRPPSQSSPEANCVRHYDFIGSVTSSSLEW